MVPISAQKPFAKNKDNGLSKYSFRGLAHIRKAISIKVLSKEFLSLSTWLPSQLIDHKAY